MRVGTADADPGELARGWLTVTDLPTGSPERLPVLVANGEREGPVCWLTAAIHGDEVTAMAAAQDVMDERLPTALSGAVVCVPVVNPSGLLQTQRASAYHGDDPNRFFPDLEAERYRPPRVQELIDERLFAAFTGEGDAVSADAAADVLCDLHTAQVGSMPFVIRDRVLYGSQRDREEAEALAADLAAIVEATGLPVVNEYAADEYTGESLQRSLAGAALNAAGIPACTLELGSHSVVEEAHRAAGVAACHRVLAARGMLDDHPDWADPADPIEPPVAYPVKRAVHPHAGTAGIVRHRRQPGDEIEAGDPVADLVTPHGEPVATVESDHDGYVLGRYEGVAAFENDPLYSLAVRDDGDLVVPRDGVENGAE